MRHVTVERVASFYRVTVEQERGALGRLLGRPPICLSFVGRESLWTNARTGAVVPWDLKIWLLGQVERHERHRYDAG